MMMMMMLMIFGGGDHLMMVLFQVFFCSYGDFLSTIQAFGGARLAARFGKCLDGVGWWVLSKFPIHTYPQIKMWCDCGHLFLTITCPKTLRITVWASFGGRFLTIYCRVLQTSYKKFIFEISWKLWVQYLRLTFGVWGKLWFDIGKKKEQTSQDAILTNESLGWNLPSINETL